MPPDQIAALAATGESETLEFKATTRTRRGPGFSPVWALASVSVRCEGRWRSCRTAGLVVSTNRGPLTRWMRAQGGDAGEIGAR